MHQTIFIVSATGVLIGTEVYPVTSREKAEHIVEDLKLKFRLEDVHELCKDCWKGYSRYAECDTEIRIHTEELN